MSSSRPLLRPPAAFEVPASSSAGDTDPWVLIQQTASEIYQLQETAKRLKENQAKPRDQAVSELSSMVPRSSVPSVPSTVPTDFMAYDNIIRRLGVTIEQLQSQLQQSELNHEKLLGQMKNEQLIKDSQYIQRTADLNAEVDALKKSHDVELRCVLVEKERQEVELAQLKIEWQKQLKVKEDVVAELEEKLRTFTESAVDRQKQTSEEIRQRDAAIEDLQQQLSQLRFYLNESDSIMKSSDIWKKEILDLRNRLQLLENEKQHFLTERDLLLTRLDSLEAILKIQEQHVDQGSVGLGSKKKSLLTIWREKVFELMVQLKAVDLSALNEKRNSTNKISMLEKNLKDMENKCQVLSHVVREKQAAGDLEGALAKSLHLELDTTKKQLEKEKSENSKNAASLLFLKDFAMKTMNSFVNLETVIKTLEGSIKSLNNRISFASGRVELLQAQFARKEAILRMEFLAKSERDVETASAVEPKEDLEHCRDELERVTAERNNLVAQVALDAQKLHQHIQNATKNATEEASHLRLKLHDLTEQYDKKSEKVEELNCLLEVARQELAENREELQSLKLELEKTHIRCKNDLENSEAQIQEDYMRQLSEVKREHTKAVVKVRQLERKMEREREKWTLNMEAIISQHKMEVRKLEEKLVITERDNNILTATLRQEGLLKKASRLRPFQSEMQLDVKTCPSESIGASPDAVLHSRRNHEIVDDFRVGTEIHALQQSDEFSVTDDVLQKVAEELKVLASQVLNEYNDDDCGEDRSCRDSACSQRTAVNDEINQTLVEDLCDADKNE